MGADAVLVHTEWQDYRCLKWMSVAAGMRKPAWGGMRGQLLILLRCDVQALISGPWGMERVYWCRSLPEVALSGRSCCWHRQPQQLLRPCASAGEA